MASAVSSGLQADPAIVAEAARLLLAPGQVCELRALSVVTPDYRRPHTVSGYFDDPARLVQAACRVSPFAQATYLTPNPIEPALLARAANRIRAVGERDSLTTDPDVLMRRWLLVDCDPVRPKGISSTDEEHELAIARARLIRAELAAAGWPEPILADSGNGAHLLYPVELPRDDGGVVKRVLEGLAFRYDDERVQVDRTVFNPARIWKLYGTPSQKGDSTPERPHRLARLIEVAT